MDTPAKNPAVSTFLTSSPNLILNLGKTNNQVKSNPLSIGLSKTEIPCIV